jgi:hypothetical protein
MRWFWWLGLMTLGGCAATIGVRQTGPDSFLVSEMRAPVLGGEGAAQQAAIGEAISFCTDGGRVFVPVTAAPSDFGHYGPMAFTAAFRCLPPNDPQLSRLPAAPAP